MLLDVFTSFFYGGNMNSRFKLNDLIKASLMGVIGFILMYIEIPILVFPSFLTYDFSDVVSLIAGFSLGPVYGVLTVLLRNIMHLFVTSTAGIGEFANFLVSGVFVFSATLYYGKKHSKKRAIIGLTIGTISMIVFSVLTNYYILLPFYSNVMPLDTIYNMASNIPGVHDKFTFVLYVIAPFNLIKALLNSFIVLLIYKKVSVLLKRDK